MKTIAIDIDDVLAENNEVMRQWANSKSGITLSSEQYAIKADYWGYYERVWAEHGVKGLSYSDFEKEMADDQSRIPLLPGASFAITELQRRYKIILITSRALVLEAATRRWLQQHFGDSTIRIYFAKSNTDNSRLSKGELCRQLGASLLIDDNIEHCQSALDNNVESILFGDYGWQHTVPAAVVRCKDWPAVLEYLDVAG